MSLIKAVRCSQIDKVKNLLGNESTNVYEMDRYGKTALMRASINGDAQIANLLLNGYGTPDFVNQQDKTGTTALIYACRGSSDGHKTIVESLLAIDNSHVNHKGDWGATALINASIGGHTEIANILLLNGASVNQSNEFAGTPLFFASRYGYTEIVKLLFLNGADVNHKTRNGVTALIAASYYENKEAIELLLLNGASVNHKSESGDCPLICASRCGHKEIVELLLTPVVAEN